jgi:hypothetical protein
MVCIRMTRILEPARSSTTIDAGVCLQGRDDGSDEGDVVDRLVVGATEAGVPGFVGAVGIDDDEALGVTELVPPGKRFLLRAVTAQAVKVEHDRHGGLAAVAGRRVD